MHCDRCNIIQICSDEAATTAEEWFSGTDAEPILVSLKVSNDSVFIDWPLSRKP